MLIGIALLTGPAARAADPAGRTFYDRLPLDTPAHAAQAFAAAYAASDFWLVFQILAPDAQKAVNTDIQLLRFEAIAPLPPVGSGNAWQDAVEDPDQSDHPFDVAWMFDRIMVVAQARNRLPFTLRVGTVPGPVEGQPPSTVVAGADGPIRITLVQAPSGRWRVLSATTAGHQAGTPPWGLDASPAH